MEHEDYKNIYVKTVLNEVKMAVNCNNMELSGKKEIETDTKLKAVINDLFFNEVYLSNSLGTAVDNEESERIISTLTVYYAALYNDNLELLNEILDNRIYLGNNRNNLNIAILDKRITSKFAKDEYLKMLEKEKDTIRDFYKGLSKNKKYDDMFYIDKFSSILNKVMKELLDEDKESVNPFEYLGAFGIIKSLDYLEEEAIINSSLKQKEYILNSVGNYFPKLDPYDRKRINDLIKNTNIEFNLDTIIMFLSKFSDEEIVKIDKLFKENKSLEDAFILRRLSNLPLNNEILKLQALISDNSKSKTKRKRISFFRKQ